jgi:hypothetical protein
MHNPTTRHIAHRATTTVLLVLVVIVGHRVCGPWPTAITAAAAATWWGLRAWARIETRTRRAPGPRAAAVAVPARPARAAVEHVAFARALAAVATAYLAECEREARS